MRSIELSIGSASISRGFRDTFAYCTNWDSFRYGPGGKSACIRYSRSRSANWTPGSRVIGAVGGRASIGSRPRYTRSQKHAQPNARTYQNEHQRIKAENNFGEDLPGRPQGRVGVVD